MPRSTLRGFYEPRVPSETGHSFSCINALAFTIRDLLWLTVVVASRMREIRTSGLKGDLRKRSPCADRA